MMQAGRNLPAFHRKGMSPSLEQRLHTATFQNILLLLLLLLWGCSPKPFIASSFMRFLDHTQWPTTLDRTLLDEWPARRRNLYLTTHNTYKRQTSMPPAGFEPTISAGERPQTNAFVCAAIGTGTFKNI